MIEALISATAHCDACGRSYRVPAGDRTYACKACGGTVRARAEEPEPPLSHAVTCPACRLVNPHGGDVCAECGEPLDSAPDPYADHAAAAGELKRGYRRMAWVGWLLRLGAAAYAAVTLAAIVAVSRAEVPLGAGLLVVAVATAMTSVLVVAALQVLYRPYPWTLAAAGLATGATALHLFGPNPLGLALPLSAACAAALWASLVPARRFQRLVAEHPDAFVLDQASRSTLRLLKGRPNQERHERLLRAMRAASRRKARISALAAGLFCLASLLGTSVVAAKVRPAELGALLTDFRAAWASGEPAAVAGFLHPGLRAQREPWLAGVFDGYGWRGGAPGLAAESVRAGADGTLVEHRVGDLTLATTWVADGRGWSIARIELPPPPLEPALADFLQAWRRSNAGAIADLFPAGYEGRMREYVERAARRRGWSRFPDVLGTERTAGEHGEQVVTLTTERERVTLKWVFRGDGRWGLKGLNVSE